MPIKKKIKSGKKFESRKSPSKKNYCGEKSFFEKIKSYWGEQEEKIRKSQVKQFEFFILGFIFFYLLISTFVSFVPQSFFESATGLTVKSLLSAQGIEVRGAVKAVEGFGEVFVMQVGNGAAAKEIIISWLCSGVFEIIILICAILASFGVKWRKKFQGIGVAAVAGFFFNALRVWITVNIALTQNIQVVEFAHDLLFRAALFIYITGFYVLWFFWAIRSDKT
ncbi:MAG: exosortase/archaeosortase family protein [archaeon]|jgi:exosortase/archaeosortase family protein